MYSFFLHIQPFLKAATKVVENEKARTLASENKPNATNTETETEVNLNKGERFVHS